MATLPAQTKQRTSTMTTDRDIAMGSHHQLAELAQPKLACQPPCVAPTGEAQRRGGEARIALALQRHRQGRVVQLPLFAIVLERSGHNVVDVLAVALACRQGVSDFISEASDTHKIGEPLCSFPALYKAKLQLSPATMAIRRPLGETTARVGQLFTPSARHIVMLPSFTTGCSIS